MRPNLFRFATSELAQDAVLCWLLAWADLRSAEHDLHLHHAGRALLEGMFAAQGVPLPSGGLVVEPRRQLDDADIVVAVGDHHLLVIEDKTGTKQHSDQLRRYEEALRDRFPGRELVLVYVKTGDQASYEDVRRQRWAVYTRRDLLGVLRQARPHVGSDIFASFHDHLEEVEARVQSFRSTAPSTWGPRAPAWMGFYEEVLHALGQGSWDYIANADGGFMGLWWAFRDVEGGKVYLQLEEDLLCVKVHVPNDAGRRAVRATWASRMAGEREGLRFRRPGRFGNGRYMTVAVLDGDYRVAGAEGRLDLPATIDQLRRATRAVAAVVDAHAAGGEGAGGKDEPPAAA